MDWRLLNIEKKTWASKVSIKSEHVKRTHQRVKLAPRKRIEATFVNESPAMANIELSQRDFMLTAGAPSASPHTLRDTEHCPVIAAIWTWSLSLTRKAKAMGQIFQGVSVPSLRFGPPDGLLLDVLVLEGPLARRRGL